MLEKLVYAGLTAAALAGAPACNTIEKPAQEQKIKINSFYTERTVLEDRSGPGSRQQNLRYTYQNGIEARVMYKRGPGDMTDIRIEVMADPNNILGHRIASSGRPQDIIYEVMADGSRTMKAVTSRIDGMVVRMISDGSDNYLKVGQKGFLIRLPMDKEDRKIFEKFEAELEVHSLIREIEVMSPTSSETFSQARQY